MPPKGKGKGSKTSKGGWREGGGGKTVSLTDFMAETGIRDAPAASTTSGDVGTDVGALKNLVSALITPGGNPHSTRTCNPGSLPMIKITNAKEQQRMVAAMQLLQEKEAKDEQDRVDVLVQARLKEALGSLKKEPGPKQKKRERKQVKQETKTAVVAIESTDESSEADEKHEEDTEAEVKPSRRARSRKKARDDYIRLREVVPPLQEFFTTIAELLHVEKPSAQADDEDPGADNSDLLRHLRRAHRACVNATPSPRGKVDRLADVADGNPTRVSSRTNAASRDLGDTFGCEPDPGEADSGSSESRMKSLLDHFGDTSPASVIKKSIPKGQTPIKLFQATLDSLVGAGSLVDKGQYPKPDELYLAKHVKQTDLDKVAPLVANMVGLTNKASAAMKKKRQEADLAAQSMIVDGLTEHVSLRVHRSMDIKQYLGVFFIWLLRAGVNLTRDPYTERLLRA